MIKAVLIDDEKNALEVLEWQVKTFCPQLQVAAMCLSADEGIEAIKTHHPQLVFLDIEMPVKNGFEVLNAFPDAWFDVIFTTAYNQFAIKAIRLAAFDYLLKPVDAEDLKECVERYMNKKGGNIKQQLQTLLEQFSAPKQPAPERIALQTAEGLIIVTPDQVIRCQSISNYTKIFLTGNRQIVVAKTLKETEEILTGYTFYRVHHSHLVNIHHVQRYVKNDGGYVVMTGGEEIAVARNRKDGFIDQFSHI